jgi:hypothetical protein
VAGNKQGTPLQGLKQQIKGEKPDKQCKIIVDNQWYFTELYPLASDAALYAALEHYQINGAQNGLIWGELKRREAKREHRWRKSQNRWTIGGFVIGGLVTFLGQLAIQAIFGGCAN